MKLIAVAFMFTVLSTTNARIRVLRYEKCDPNVEPPIDIYVKIKDMGDHQILEKGSLKTTVPMGNNIELVAEGYSYENGKYEFFISFKKDYCDTINQYARDFVNDLETAAGIEPGSCPLPAGEYSVQNHRLNYGQLKRAEDLDGQMKIVINFMDKATNTSLSCVEIEVKNEEAESDK